MKRVVIDIGKNTREVVRVELDEFAGRQLIAVRIWYRDDTGTLRPTPKGLAIDIRHLPGLRRALEEAEELALGEGLLQQPSESQTGTGTDPGLTNSAVPRDGR